MAVPGWGIFLILILIVGAGAAGGWILYSQYRARKLGLPPPSLNPFSQGRRTGSSTNYAGPPVPAPGGIGGWISDKINNLRNNTRTASGAYEASGYRAGGGYGADHRSRGSHGFGPLDPDEAWDARVDHEVGGYYEETELGDTNNGPYSGGGYGGSTLGFGGSAASRQRELDARYDEEMHGGAAATQKKTNPFGDDAEHSSLRSVSPRPVAGNLRSTSYHGAAHAKGKASVDDTSPTERRSMFREDV